MTLPQDTYGIILQLRSGKQDDPYKNLTETITVTSNSLAILKEIPDKFYHVQIKDSSGNSLYEITNGIPEANEFLVDYNNGNITFNFANNGKQFTATYTGTGAIYISADRIATQINGSNDIAQTLQDLTDELNNIIANANKNISIKPYTQTWNATDGQTVFTTTNSYNPNTSTLQLYVGGIYQPYSSYTQTDANTITLSEGISVPSGETVTVTAVWFMNNIDSTTDITTVSGYGTNIGDASSLTTTSKTVTGAINETSNKIGDLSKLNTTDKTSVINAINEVYNGESPVSKIGDLTKLTTTHKTDLVSAINDNASQLADIGYDAKNSGMVADCVLDGSGNYVSGTDNTQALIDAINATPVHGPLNPILLIPPGMYYFSTISVTKSNITIMGYGATLVTSVTTSTQPRIFNLIGNGIKIFGLNFQTGTPFNVDTTVKAANSSGGLMLRIGDAQNYYENIVLRDMSFDGSFGAIDIQWCSNVRVLNCDIKNSVGNGINFVNCKRDVWVIGNTTENTRDDGIVCVCDSSYAQGTDNWVVENNKIKNSYGKGIDCTGVNSAVVKNNWINNTWSAGIIVFNDTTYSLAKSRNVKVEGNTIINAGKYFGTGQFKTAVSNNEDGIYVSNDTFNVHLKNNFIFSPQRYGVYVGLGARKVVVNGNEILATGSAGINVGDTTDVTYTSAGDIEISNNRVIDTQSHGIIIGGVNETIIIGNKVKSWLAGNRCIYMKNIKNAFIDQNISNNNITTVWKASTYYYVGQYILPATSNGHAYKCTVSGLSGATEPSWNTSGSTNTDGGVTWSDFGTTLTRGIAGTPYLDTNGTNVGVQNTTNNYSLANL